MPLNRSGTDTDLFCQILDRHSGLLSMPVDLMAQGLNAELRPFRHIRIICLRSVLLLPKLGFQRFAVQFAAIICRCLTDAPDNAGLMVRPVASISIYFDAVAFKFIAARESANLEASREAIGIAFLRKRGSGAFCKSLKLNPCDSARAC